MHLLDVVIVGRIVAVGTIRPGVCGKAIQIGVWHAVGAAKHRQVLGVSISHFAQRSCVGRVDFLVERQVDTLKARVHAQRPEHGLCSCAFNLVVAWIEHLQVRIGAQCATQESCATIADRIL